MKLNVATKLIGSFVIVLALTGAAGWVGIRVASDANVRIQNMFDLDVIGLEVLSDLSANVLKIRAMALQHILYSTAEDQDALEAEMARGDEQIVQAIAALESSWQTPAKLQTLAELRVAWADYTAARNDMLELSRNQQDVQAEAAARGEVRDKVEVVQQKLNELIDLNKERARERMNESEAAFTSGLYLAFGVVAFAVLIGLTLAVYISRSFARNIQAVTRAAQALTAGDLNQRVEVHSGDEVEQLAVAFNSMAGQLQHMVNTEQQAKAALEHAVNEYSHMIGQVAEGDLTVRLHSNGNDNGDLARLSADLNQMVAGLNKMSAQIRGNSQSLLSSSTQILAATSEQAASAREQAAAISETTSTVDEVRQTAEHASDRARLVTEMVRDSIATAERGLHTVQDASSGMRSIKEQVGAIAETILALSEQTQQIGEIIATVNDIADQSNLLALNAAIEAARAGEAGKGFAVVAGEVRSLAEQSVQATAQVKEILGEIQKAANTAVMVTEEGTKRADMGVQLAASTGESFQTLLAHVRQMAEAAQQISSSASEQLIGMDQIATAMENIRQATIQSESGTRQVESAVQNLTGMAAQLSGLVEQYTLN